jgi:hypothetical protein
MNKRMLSLLVILLIVGCGPKTSPQSSSGKEEPKISSGVQVRVGGTDEDEAHHLSFKITAVHEKQTLSKENPFHVKGGEWTFFDCQAGNDLKATFSVGVQVKSGAGSAPIAWGRAVLIVMDREAGAKFVELFSKSFPGQMPTTCKRPHVPGPLFINTAILGENLKRGPKGGFNGEGGGWTATKWFPEHDGRSAEVFFNYNLDKRQGEFSEKDADYADDLLAIFASALRDGPRPERTPENDPNLTRTGPTIGQSRKLLPDRAAHYSFSPNGQFAVYQDKTSISALPIDVPDGKVFEIARFDYSPWEMKVLNDDLDVLVQEGVPGEPGVKSSADAMRIWWVDGKSKAKRLLRKPEKGINLAEAPVSPDHRYIALDQWRDNPGGKGRTKLLHILVREDGTAKIIESSGKELSVVGWKKTETGFRALAVTNRWQFDNKEPSELYLADPSTGKLERQEQVDARSEIDNRLSPDEKHRVRVGKDELILPDVADGKQRKFVFHEDDRRFVGEECIEWVSPRYLKFNGQRLALIDVTTMKMCFPVSADATKFGSSTYKFSSDFRWVMYQGEGIDGEGLFLAPVELPKE